MWVYRTGKRCNSPPVILFNYETTRGGYHPKEFLKGYSGFLTVDSYFVWLESMADLKKANRPTEPPKIARLFYFAFPYGRFDAYY